MEEKEARILIVRRNMDMKASSLMLLLLLSGCCIGGMGFDSQRAISQAENWPVVQSSRVHISKSASSYGTFSQAFDEVFSDFPVSGEPVMNGRRKISGTDYEVAYQQFELTLTRDNRRIVHERLPKVFYMHPMCYAVIPGQTQEADLILCSIRSRATTGLQYVAIFDGRGNVLLRKVMRVGKVWDIVYERENHIVIAGARSKTGVTINR